MKVFLVMKENKNEDGYDRWPDHWDIEVAFDNVNLAERFIDNKRGADRALRFIKEVPYYASGD